MSVLRELRSLVLGDTWTVPLGVAVVVGAGAVVHALAPEFWRDAGGALLLAGVAGVLVAAVGRRNES
jgi:hypothetical protein